MGPVWSLLVPLRAAVAKICPDTRWVVLYFSDNLIGLIMPGYFNYGKSILKLFLILLWLWLPSLSHRDRLIFTVMCLTFCIHQLWKRSEILTRMEGRLISFFSPLDPPPTLSLFLCNLITPALYVCVIIPVQRVPIQNPVCHNDSVCLCHCLTIQHQLLIITLWHHKTIDLANIN